MEKKIAVVTGSTRGIGKAIATELASRGCFVIVHGSERSKEQGEQLAQELKGAFISADVSAYEDCVALAKLVGEKYKHLDILVNNAGITADRTLKKMTHDEWKKVLAVNLDSLFNVTQTLLPLISDGSAIVNISSIVGITGNFGQTNYAASKAGAIGFTKSLAKELGKKKIRVNAVAPGFIQTEMTEHLPMEALAGMLQLTSLGEMGKPEDIAKAVAFLVSDDARFITGTVLRVDGGLNF